MLTNSGDAFHSTECAKIGPHRRVSLWRQKMMRILALTALTLPSLSLAGQVSGVIQTIHMGPHYGTKVFVKVTGTATAQPACAINDFQFVFDSNTPTGRALLATALAAYGAGQPVTVNGYDQCTLWNSSEDLRWMQVGG